MYTIITKVTSFLCNSVKLYPDVGRGFADGLTQSLHILIEKIVFSSKIKSAMDCRCFTIYGIDDYEQEFSCLVIMSDDSDENVKSSSDVDSCG